MTDAEIEAKAHRRVVDKLRALATGHRVVARDLSPTKESDSIAVHSLMAQRFARIADTEEAHHGA